MKIRLTIGLVKRTMEYSDAFNKGMDLAKGDYLGFLNSDDIYYSENTLDYVVDAFEKNLDLDFLYGPVKTLGIITWL